MTNLLAHPRRVIDPVTQAAITAALAAVCATAHAGRPLNTDDAATAGAATCQVEGWAESTRRQRALVLAPACGLGETTELGLDVARASPREDSIADVGGAFKWVPEAGAFDTPIGQLQLGAKLFFGTTRPVTADWRLTGGGARLLATLQLSPVVNLHVNLGPQHDRDSSHSSVLFNIAAVWAPVERTLLFVETRASDRRELDGRALSSLGARYWLVQDKIGLDVTASREAGSNNPTTLTFGFGWYGLGLQ